MKTHFCNECNHATDLHEYKEGFGYTYGSEHGYHEWDEAVTKCCGADYDTIDIEYYEPEVITRYFQRFGKYPQRLKKVN